MRTGRKKTPERGLTVDTTVHVSAVQDSGKQRRSRAIRDNIMDLAPARVFLYVFMSFLYI